MPRVVLIGNEDDIIKRYKSGESVNKIAQSYGVTKSAVERCLKRCGISLQGIKIPLDVQKIADMYTSGMSENAIAKQLNVSRSVIRRRLVESGVVIRGKTEANQLAMSKRTPEENRRNTRAAHDAVRGKPQSHEVLCKRAVSRQRNFSAFGSPYEQDIADELTKRGIKFVPQLAIDKYNIDFAIGGSIAFEVFGGNWHAHGRHRARFEERSKKLFDCRYTIVICWIGFNHRFNPSAIVDYLVSLNEILRSDPSASCKHYVIGGDGKPCSVGSSNLNYTT